MTGQRSNQLSYVPRLCFQQHGYMSHRMSVFSQNSRFSLRSDISLVWTQVRYFLGTGWTPILPTQRRSVVYQMFPSPLTGPDRAFTHAGSRLLESISRSVQLTAGAKTPDYLFIDGVHRTTIAKPESICPEVSAFKSTRLPGSGDPAQRSKGHGHSGVALVVRSCAAMAACPVIGFAALFPTRLSLNLTTRE